MGTLIGRDSELSHIQRYLDRAGKEPVAGSLCLSGASGIGKSAVLEVAASAAAADGWIVVSVACHRIQAGLPLAVARRTLQVLLASLGDERARYTSGLGDIENPAVESILPGLIEGLTFDSPVVFILDDFQWIDGESARLIRATIHQLADRPFVVLAASQRADEAIVEHFSFDTTTTIEELRPGDARSVVASIFQGSDPAIIDAILDHAAGNTVDLIALAEAAQENAAGTPDQVASSMRNVVAQRVKSLDRRERELLQLCSIMPEPIEYGLLTQLFPDEHQLTKMIENVSGRYLARNDGKLAFAHRAIATAVLETIPVDIPLRRRVIAALESLPFPTTENRFHVAEQALACNDQRLAHTHFLALAREGTANNLPRVVAEASQAALRIGPPPQQSIVSFYAEYAKALSFLGYFNDVIALLETGIREASRADGASIGELVLQLIVAQCLNDDVASARSTYRRFEATITDPHDREFIEAGALWFAVCEADDDLFAKIERRLRKDGGPKNPEIRLRLTIVTAYLASRRGEYSAALHALDQAAQEVRSVNSPVRNILDVTATVIDFGQHGTTIYERNLPELFRRFAFHNDGGYLRYFIPYGFLVSGKWVEGESSLHDSLNHAHEPLDRLRLLGLAAMVAALRGTTTPYDDELEQEAHRFLNGANGVWYCPLAAWWSARIANDRPEQARGLLTRALDRCSVPAEPQFRLPFTGFALAAKRLGRPMLEHFVSHSPWTDRTPVNQAESNIALAIARDGLGERDADRDSNAIQHCGTLGLHLYAMVARSILSPTDTAAAGQLTKMGIYATTPASKRRGETPPTNNLTARERHVASVIAEGLTNRDIAERLVLSERTIEAHVANIFNKLNVSSRTQIAAWYLRSTAAD